MRDPSCVHVVRVQVDVDHAASEKDAKLTIMTDDRDQAAVTVGILVLPEGA
jgi:hypothetical protein